MPSPGSLSWQPPRAERERERVGDAKGEARGKEWGRRGEERGGGDRREGGGRGWGRRREEEGEGEGDGVRSGSFSEKCV